MLKLAEELWGAMTASVADTYRFRQFVVDARSACLRGGGVIVSSAEIVRRPPVSRAQSRASRLQGRAVRQLWADVVVTDNSLVQCIKEIRQALGDNRQTMVETVPSAAMCSRRRSLKADAAPPRPLSAGGGNRCRTDGRRSRPSRQRRTAVALPAGITAVLVIAAEAGWAWSSRTIPQQPVEARPPNT